MWVAESAFEGSQRTGGDAIAPYEILARVFHDIDHRRLIIADLTGERSKRSSVADPPQERKEVSRFT